MRISDWSSDVCSSDLLDLLLVDEFQDTSPIQLALFMKLTALAAETFWVGDIKQSIYGFRGSDSQLMESVISALPKLGGTRSEEHTSELQSLMRISYAVFCLKKKKTTSEKISTFATQKI